MRGSLKLGMLALLFACAKERPREARVECPTWETDFAALFADRCSTCHGPPEPATGYDLTDYVSAIERGPRLIEVLATPDETHRPFADLFNPARQWIEACESAFLPTRIHPPGIMNPHDPEFHGALIAAERYDFDLCRRCHGEDLRGGASGHSCFECHAEGPTACTTCHGSTPESGAHPIHVLGGPLEKTIDCSACHVKPRDFADAGHVFTVDGSIDPPPAEVLFPPPPAPPTFQVAAPTFDREAMTCVNVWCHAPATPRWEDLPGPLGCDGCHGAPPPDHASDRCVHCHEEVTPERHVNGIVELGVAGTECWSCHGMNGDPAPPLDLDNRESTRELGVGAHQAHLEPPFRLRGPLVCSDCHLVPSDLFARGHIDTPPPAEVVSSELPFAWDRESATCSGWCHGFSEPRWTGGTGEVFCGACHGVPPADDVHSPSFTLRDCAICHPSTVSELGAIRIEGERSEHIDGDLDL